MWASVTRASIARRRRNSAARVETLLQRLELAPQLVRQRVAKAREVLVDLRELHLPLLRVNLQQLLHLGRRQVQARGLDRAWRGHEPDGGLHGVRLAVAAAEDPGQHAAVVAQAGPDELAAAVLAEPVDHEDLGQPRVLAAARLEPV